MFYTTISLGHTFFPYKHLASLLKYSKHSFQFTTLLTALEIIYTYKKKLTLLQNLRPAETMRYKMSTVRQEAPFSIVYHRKECRRMSYTPNLSQSQNQPYQTPNLSQYQIMNRSRRQKTPPINQNTASKQKIAKNSQKRTDLRKKKQRTAPRRKRQEPPHLERNPSFFYSKNRIPTSPNPNLKQEGSKKPQIPDPRSPILTRN